MIDATRLLPMSAEVHIGSLRTLAAAWADRATGTVTSPGAEPVTLVAGEGSSLDAPDRLAAAICAPGLEFTPDEVEHDGLNVPLGGLLVEAARLVADPRAIRRRPRVLVSEGPRFSRARHRLPLPSVTQALLSQALRSGMTLQEALRAEGVGAGVVADDLAALVALEFIELQPVPRRPDEDHQITLSQPAITPAAVSPGIVIALRLEREWTLFEESDDWAVLGLRSGSSSHQVNAAGRRMRHRYLSLADRDDLSEAAQATGRRLLERVDIAVRRLLSGAPPRTPPPDASGLQAVRVGWLAVEELDYDEARRWFERARKDPRTAAAAMAGLGWVEMIDPLSPAEAQDDGIVLLRLAAGVEPGDARIRWLLARAEEIRTRTGMPST